MEVPIKDADNASSGAASGGVGPPSPLTGCYLLVVIGEPHSAEHKELILHRLVKGLLSWDVGNCHVDLEEELSALTSQSPEGEEARHGERLIQYATENLVTEILIHPQVNTLVQCIRNLLSSFTRHRHLVHAGYTFGGNGSWLLQDGTFSLADFSEAFQDQDVQRVLRAYPDTVTLDLHCAPSGHWSSLSERPFTRGCRLRVNPNDVLPSGSDKINEFIEYLSPMVVPADISSLLESSDVVGNIRFSHPTLYVFPGGQGDAALFGINGFNMLVDGGFGRKACFWDFARHLDRLDAVLMTRLNNSNISGLGAVVSRKKSAQVYPQIGHFFCNMPERKGPLSPDGDKDRDPLTLDLLEKGHDLVTDLRALGLKPQQCYRDAEPVNLYHKVGHGTLDMYVLSPSKDAKEVKEFLQKWNSNDQRLFAQRRDSKEFVFPIQNLVSICALLVWQPANPNDNITRILFPGSTPDYKIFEGLDKIKHLEFMRHPICTTKQLTPSASIVGLKQKLIKAPAMIDKIIPDSFIASKAAKIERDNKIIDNKKAALKNDDKVDENKVSEEIKTDVKLAAKLASATTVGASKTKPIKDKKIIETKKTDLKNVVDGVSEDKKKDNKIETDKKNVTKDEDNRTVKAKQKEHKSKIDTKSSTAKTRSDSKSSKSTERKSVTRVVEKKPEVIKSTPTTPKKIEPKPVVVNGISKEKEMVKAKLVNRTTKSSPTSTPAKSAKEANNRKVLESKFKAALPKKELAKSADRKEIVKVERKPISRRPKGASPSRRAPGSPIKSSKSTPTTSVKSDKDGVVKKSKPEMEGTTDSSTVSTPTAEQETLKKIAMEAHSKTDIDAKQLQELVDLQEEQEVVRELEAVFNRENGIKEQLESSDAEVSKQTDDSKQVSTADGEEDEEYLIIEKEEVEQYTEDSINEQESVTKEEEIQKHQRDSEESEKKRKESLEAVTSEGDAEDNDEIGDKETAVDHEKGATTLKEKQVEDEIEKDSLGEGDQEQLEENDEQEVAQKLNEDKTDIIEQSEKTPEEARKKITTDLQLSPDHKDENEEDIQEITTPAEESAKNKSDPKEEIKTEEISTASPEEKHIDDGSSGKKTDTREDLDEQDHDGAKDNAEQNLPESQPDEKISTTIESGATTAPTLPEDERIPLDEIKEDQIEEKYAKEETKENELATNVLPTKLEPLQSAGAIQFDAHQAHLRDIVKTPDEVADLPFHEEVEYAAHEDFPGSCKKKKEDGKEKDSANEKDKDEYETKLDQNEKSDFDNIAAPKDAIKNDFEIVGSPKDDNKFVYKTKTPESEAVNVNEFEDSEFDAVVIEKLEGDLKDKAKMLGTTVDTSKSYKEVVKPDETEKGSKTDSTDTETPKEKINIEEKETADVEEDKPHEASNNLMPKKESKPKDTSVGLPREIKTPPQLEKGTVETALKIVADMMIKTEELFLEDNDDDESAKSEDMGKQIEMELNEIKDSISEPLTDTDKVDMSITKHVLKEVEEKDVDTLPKYEDLKESTRLSDKVLKVPDDASPLIPDQSSKDSSESYDRLVKQQLDFTPYEIKSYTTELRETHITTVESPLTEDMTIPEVPETEDTQAVDSQMIATSSIVHKESAASKIEEVISSDPPKETKIKSSSPSADKQDDSLKDKTDMQDQLTAELHINSLKLIEDENEDNEEVLVISEEVVAKIVASVAVVLKSEKDLEEIIQEIDTRTPLASLSRERSPEPGLSRKASPLADHKPETEKQGVSEPQGEKITIFEIKESTQTSEKVPSEKSTPVLDTSKIVSDVDRASVLSDKQLPKVAPISTDSSHPESREKSPVPQSPKEKSAGQSEKSTPASGTSRRESEVELAAVPYDKQAPKIPPSPTDSIHPESREKTSVPHSPKERSTVPSGKSTPISATSRRESEAELAAIPSDKQITKVAPNLSDSSHTDREKTSVPQSPKAASSGKSTPASGTSRRESEAELTAVPSEKQASKVTPLSTTSSHPESKEKTQIPQSPKEDSIAQSGKSTPASATSRRESEVELALAPSGKDTTTKIVPTSTGSSHPELREETFVPHSPKERSAAQSEKSTPASGTSRRESEAELASVPSDIHTAKVAPISMESSHPESREKTPVPQSPNEKSAAQSGKSTPASATSRRDSEAELSSVPCDSQTPKVAPSSKDSSHPVPREKTPIPQSPKEKSAAQSGKSTPATATSRRESEVELASAPSDKHTATVPPLSTDSSQPESREKSPIPQSPKEKTAALSGKSTPASTTSRRESETELGLVPSEKQSPKVTSSPTDSSYHESREKTPISQSPKEISAVPSGKSTPASGTSRRESEAEVRLVPSEKQAPTDSSHPESREETSIPQSPKVKYVVISGKSTPASGTSRRESEAELASVLSEKQAPKVTPSPTDSSHPEYIEKTSIPPSPKEKSAVQSGKSTPASGTSRRESEAELASVLSKQAPKVTHSPTDSSHPEYIEKTSIPPSPKEKSAVQSGKSTPASGTSRRESEAELASVLSKQAPKVTPSPTDSSHPEYIEKTSIPPSPKEKSAVQSGRSTPASGTSRRESEAEVGSVRSENQAPTDSSHPESREKTSIPQSPKEKSAVPSGKSTPASGTSRRESEAEVGSVPSEKQAPKVTPSHTDSSHAESTDKSLIPQSPKEKSAVPSEKFTPASATSRRESEEGLASVPSDQQTPKVSPISTVSSHPESVEKTPILASATSRRDSEAELTPVPPDQQKPQVSSISTDASHPESIEQSPQEKSADQSGKSTPASATSRRESKVELASVPTDKQTSKVTPISTDSSHPESIDKTLIPQSPKEKSAAHSEKSAPELATSRRESEVELTSVPSEKQTPKISPISTDSSDPESREKTVIPQSPKEKSAPHSEKSRRESEADLASVPSDQQTHKVAASHTDTSHIESREKTPLPQSPKEMSAEQSGKSTPASATSRRESEAELVSVPSEKETPTKVAPSSTASPESREKCSVAQSPKEKSSVQSEKSTPASSMSRRESEAEVVLIPSGKGTPAKVAPSSTDSSHPESSAKTSAAQSSIEKSPVEVSALINSSQQEDKLKDTSILIRAETELSNKISSSVDIQDDTHPEEIFTDERVSPFPELSEKEELLKQKEEAGTVHRMLVTASSEDGGTETEICPKGSIIFTQGSTSSSPSASGKVTPVDAEQGDHENEEHDDEIFEGVGKSIALSMREGAILDQIVTESKHDEIKDTTKSASVLPETDSQELKDNVINKEKVEIVSSEKPELSTEPEDKPYDDKEFSVQVSSNKDELLLLSGSTTPGRTTPDIKVTRDLDEQSDDDEDELIGKQVEETDPACKISPKSPEKPDLISGRSTPEIKISDDSTNHKICDDNEMSPPSSPKIGEITPEKSSTFADNDSTESMSTTIEKDNSRDKPNLIEVTSDVKIQNYKEDEFVEKLPPGKVTPEPKTSIKETIELAAKEIIEKGLSGDKYPNEVQQGIKDLELSFVLDRLSKSDEKEPVPKSSVNSTSPDITAKSTSEEILDIKITPTISDIGEHKFKETLDIFTQDKESSGRSTPPTVPVSPIAKDFSSQQHPTKGVVTSSEQAEEIIKHSLRDDLLKQLEESSQLSGSSTPDVIERSGKSSSGFVSPVQVSSENITKSATSSIDHESSIPTTESSSPKPSSPFPKEVDKLKTDEAKASSGINTPDLSAKLSGKSTPDLSETVTKFDDEVPTEEDAQTSETTSTTITTVTKKTTDKDGKQTVQITTTTKEETKEPISSQKHEARNQLSGVSSQDSTQTGKSSSSVVEADHYTTTTTTTTITTTIDGESDPKSEKTVNTVTKDELETRSKELKEEVKEVDTAEKRVHKKEPPEVPIAMTTTKTDVHSSTQSIDEYDAGDVSSPRSDISSGQVSRIATISWHAGSTEERDDKHFSYEEPDSPTSVTSQVAHSPQNSFSYDGSEFDKKLSTVDMKKDFEDLKDVVVPRHGSEDTKDKLSMMIDPMSASLYGELPEAVSKTMSASSKIHSDTTESTKLDHRFLDEADMDFEKALEEHRQARGEDLMSAITSKYEYSPTKYANGQPDLQTYRNGKSDQKLDFKLEDVKSASKLFIDAEVAITGEKGETHMQETTAKKSEVVESGNSAQTSPPETKKEFDPITTWGKPLGLPSKMHHTSTSAFDNSSRVKVDFDPIAEWGRPLHLPSPLPPVTVENNMKTTPKKEKKNITTKIKLNNEKNLKDGRRRSESPNKVTNRKVNPIYVDLTYVPHHGNSHYCHVEFFKRVRARYYVFSGTEPSKEVYSALLEAKQTWEDKDLEVTIIPTYDTDVLGYWVSENEDLLARHRIDLSPSASRCTINLQDHETSCSAYRLEF